MRAVLAANVRALTDHVFVAYPDRVKALVKASGVSKAQVYRVLSSDSGATIDIIERLALALDVQVYQLLIPNLDAKNPQVIQGASAAERQMYASFARGHHPAK
jgi:transcriptional regulator with XRE-family HTH domain